MGASDRGIPQLTLGVDQAVRIVIADDHYVSRAGLRATLEQLIGVEVVAEASDGVEALEMVRAHQPDVLLLDIEMPRMTGIEVLRTLRSEGLLVRVLVLSAYTDEEYVYGVLDHGAAGYLVKEEAERESIVEALQGIASESEDLWISPNLARDIVRSRVWKPDRTNRLSEREVDVVREVAHGGDNKEVGRTLSIAPNTVRNHVERIKAKIGVRTRAELVAWAWERGVVRR